MIVPKSWRHYANWSPSNCPQSTQASKRLSIKDIGKDKTVIFSSHILSEVESIADRVIIINQGKIVADEATANLRNVTQDETLIRVEFEMPGFDFSYFKEKEMVHAVDQHSDTQFTLRSGADIDIRKELFEKCVAQKNVILSLSKETFTLEDAFRKLTQWL